MKLISRTEAGAQLLRDTRGDPPDNGVLLSAHELPVDALWRWPVQFVVVSMHRRQDPHWS